MTTLLDWLEYMKRRVRWSWAFFPLKRIQIQSFIPSSALHIPLSISLTNSSTSCQDPQTLQARPIINTFEKPWNSFQKAARRNSKFPTRRTTPLPPTRSARRPTPAASLEPATVHLLPSHPLLHHEPNHDIIMPRGAYDVSATNPKPNPPKPK